MRLPTHLSLRSLSQLSRWPEHVPFTVPLTLAGAIMAARSEGPDGRLAVVLAANVLAVTCAFVINDVEDAADDARDPARGARNAVAQGAISPGMGRGMAVLSGALALALYALLNATVFGLGALTVGLAWLYSWRRVRLKAYPAIDVVSHALMLSSLLWMTGYFAFDCAPGAAWWVALAVGLVSAYGQVYNQVRDFDMDRAAGLRNTASVLGAARSRWTMHLLLLGAAVSLAISILQGVWPLWLALVPAACAPLMLLVRPSADMRGTQAIDFSGRAQIGFIVIANVTVIVWLLAALLG